MEFPQYFIKVNIEIYKHAQGDSFLRYMQFSSKLDKI